MLVRYEKRYRMKSVNNDLLVTSITTDEAFFSHHTNPYTHTLHLNLYTK
jgi:hypothetical protein